MLPTQSPSCLSSHPRRRHRRRRQRQRHVRRCRRAKKLPILPIVGDPGRPDELCSFDVAGSWNPLRTLKLDRRKFYSQPLSALKWPNIQPTIESLGNRSRCCGSTLGHVPWTAPEWPVLGRTGRLDLDRYNVPRSGRSEQRSVHLEFLFRTVKSGFRFGLSKPTAEHHPIDEKLTWSYRVENVAMSC